MSAPTLLQRVEHCIRELEHDSEIPEDMKPGMVLGYLKGVIDGVNHMATITQPENAAFAKASLETTKADVLRIGEIINDCAMEPTHD